MASVTLLSNEIIDTGKNVINQNFTNVNAELTQATSDIGTLQTDVSNIPVTQDANSITAADILLIMQASMGGMLETHTYFTSGINLDLIQRIDYRVVNGGPVLVEATYAYVTGSGGQIVDSITWRELPASTNRLIRTDTYTYDASDKVLTIVRA